MTNDNTIVVRNLELAVRIGALFLVIYFVVQIVAPFIPTIAWAVIIAVNGRIGLAATLFTLFAMLILVIPAASLGKSMIEWGTAIAKQISEGTLQIPPPPDKVTTWPIIGEQVHEYWTLASTNLSETVKTAEVQLRAIGEWLLRTAAGVGMGVIQFALSIIIAGVMLAKSEDGASFARKLFQRLAPSAAAKFVTLSEQTIRSVAVGVIGVALIQAALVGVALIAIDVPGAPIWIIVTVLLGIVQLPASLVIVPILIWVWGSQETLAAALFTAWIVPAGLADNVLKPILLGRGVETPMLVIFIGAIGGFVLSGIIGLFVGAVILVLAYELFKAWLNESNATQGMQS